MKISYFDSLAERVTLLALTLTGKASLTNEITYSLDEVIDVLKIIYY